MIQVIQEMSEMVDQWSIDDKCGFCWTFTAPLRESDLNEYQFREGEECCVLVAVTDYSVECVQNVDRTTGLKRLGYFTHDFTLHFLTQSDIGTNVYNEISGHPLSESKWVSILQPLLNCVGCDSFDWCAQIGNTVEVSRWRGSTKLDWGDNNLTGWSFSVQLRENNIEN